MKRARQARTVGKGAASLRRGGEKSGGIKEEKGELQSDDVGVVKRGGNE